MNPLAPLGMIYARGVDLRNAMYDRGWLRTHDLGARTISIGNLTAGGTGKTPLVAAVARMLIDHGEKVCILTRGYGRRNAGSRVLVSDGANILVDAETGGDEPVELARQLGGKAVIVADADRVSAAEWAQAEFGITAFILDDGYQNRRAGRDLDIVCIDATRPFDNGHVIPAGTLRESFKNLSRANAIVVTRSNLVDSTDELAVCLRSRNASAPIFFASNRIDAFIGLGDFSLGNDSSVSAQSKAKDRFIAFCGLGNPENFYAQLRLDGIDVVATKTFPDHYRYTAETVAQLEKFAAEHQADALITTAKDAVKLSPEDFSISCLVAKLGIEVCDSDAFNVLVSEPRRAVPLE